MAPKQSIIGITGHLGAGRSTVARILSDRCHLPTISMSGLIQKSHDACHSIDQLQSKGDELRKRDGDAAIAQLALQEMTDSDTPGYAVDGVKHPAEAQLLAKEGDFFLLAVQASQKTRWERSREKLNDDRNQFDIIDKRDHTETDQWGVPIAHGQRVGDCLLLADAIIWNDKPFQSFLSGSQQGTLAELEKKIGRFCEVIDSPGQVAPSLGEIRMSQAYAISRRSSCLRRKVGAVITNPYGRIVAEGYNEVPPNQFSCKDVYRRCYREKLREEELLALSQLFACGKCGGKLSSDVECTDCDKRYTHVVPRRHNLDYCRALHAEENAILQVSRHGGMGLEGGIIYATTFPCALCAKKIVSCKIRTVIFTEPYDIPEALQFFQDAKTELLSFEGFTHKAFQKVFS